MVSPSRTEKTGPVKAATAREGLNRNRREQRTRTHILPGDTMETRQKDAHSMKLNRQCIDDASLHRFCG